MDKYEQRRLNLLELVRVHCDGRAAGLARRLSCTDSYASRMLYPEGKAGKKRIGEDMVERINEAFGLELGELDAPLGDSLAEAGIARPPAPKDQARPSLPQYAWISEEEAELITLYRTTDERGRVDIMNEAKLSPRVILPGIARNQS